MADSATLDTFFDSQSHSQTQIPKLEDFLGDSSSSFNVETQDSSSLNQIYDPRHHTGVTGFFSDHASDSASIGRTHISNGSEFIGGYGVESSKTAEEVGFHGGCTTEGALSLGFKKKTESPPLSCNKTNKEMVVVESSDDSKKKKKITESFGQRTSIYRGVTR